MLQPKDILGKPVVATSSGREVGSVDHLLFEPGRHHLYGMVIKPRDKKDPERLLHSNDVKAIGSEAVTVEREEQVGLYDADDRARDYMQFGLHGLRVLTEDGNELGKVDTLLLNDDGSIEAYQTSGGLLGLTSGKQIKVSDVVSAGEDAIVVQSGVEESATSEEAAR